MLMILLVLSQAKQIQIDDMFSKLDNSSGDLERLREEKDQEIAILQEGMDSTIQQLSDIQQVGTPWSLFVLILRASRRKASRWRPQTHKLTPSSSTTGRS